MKYVFKGLTHLNRVTPGAALRAGCGEVRQWQVAHLKHTFQNRVSDEGGVDQGGSQDDILLLMWAGVYSW